MSEVDEIKARIDLVDFISQRMKLTRAGRSLKGLCPFHNEKSPSFMVSPERAVWHCFGCGKGGSVFDFLMEYEHIDFYEALETLAELAGITLTQKSDPTPEGKLKTTIYEVNHLAGEYYQYLLKSHSVGEKARMYVKTRGITDKSQQTFGLGYSPQSWDGLLTFLTKRGYDGELLEKAGLVLRSEKSTRHRYYDRFRGRLMFPLRDHRGNIAGFAGRLIQPEAGQSAGRQEAKYINTSETVAYVKSNMLYGLDVTKRMIQDKGEAIVMEGELDIISSFQAGIANVVAIKGSALTDGHVRLLSRFTKKLVFALDNDIAGDAAARRGIERADNAGFEMRVATLAGGKDPDDLARENPAALKDAMKQAAGIYDYLFSSALTRHSTDTAYGKKAISDELLPVLAKIDNAIVSGHYMKKLSDILSVSEEVIADGVARVKRDADKGIDRRLTKDMKRQSEIKPSVNEKLEVYILGLVLQGDTKTLFDDMLETVSIRDFTSPPVLQILTALQIALGDTPFLIKDFADSLPAELVPVFNEAYLIDTSAFIESTELFTKEWLKAVRALRQRVLRKKIKDLSQRVGSVTDPAEVRKYQEELKNASSELSVLSKSIRL